MCKIKKNINFVPLKTIDCVMKKILVAGNFSKIIICSMKIQVWTKREHMTVQQQWNAVFISFTRQDNSNIL